MGAHARDLRPAGETADRVGQRPIHAKHCGLRVQPVIDTSKYAAPTATHAIIAVHVVTEGASSALQSGQVLLGVCTGPINDIACAVVLKCARICRARRRHATEHTCTTPRAVPGPSTHSEPGQLTAQLHCHEPMASDGTLPARARLRNTEACKELAQGSDRAPPNNAASTSRVRAHAHPSTIYR
jgi:hypothetical protein